MNVFRRFFHWLSSPPRKRARRVRPEQSSRTRAESVQFELQADVEQDLRELAVMTRRPPEDLADELIVYALQQYQAAKKHLETWDGLTRREKQIAARIWAGDTNQEIAARLYISPETVKTHLRRILQKFEVENRQELRAVLRQWDLSPWL